MGKFERDVRDGKVPGFSIDVDSPWIAREDVTDECQQGTRIKFHGEGGYDDGAFARRALVVGDAYTLKAIEVRDWESFVEVEEVPGRFNSIHFELIK